MTRCLIFLVGLVLFWPPVAFACSALFYRLMSGVLSDASTHLPTLSNLTEACFLIILLAPLVIAVRRLYSDSE